MVGLLEPLSLAERFKLDTLFEIASLVLTIMAVEFAAPLEFLFILMA